MNVPRVGYCVFSDDMRQEVGGKTSLIGIYHGSMNFSVPPPVVLPKLCATVWIIAEPDDVPSELHLSALAPDKTEIFELDSEFAHPIRTEEGAQKAVISITCVMSSITLNKDGYLEVWLETEREKFRAGRLLISFKEPTRDDPQPTA